MNFDAGEKVLLKEESYLIQGAIFVFIASWAVAL